MLTHRDKGGWRGRTVSPTQTLDGVYVSVNPHSARAACRFPAKFSRDPGNYEQCGEKEGGKVYTEGGEKRDRFLVACAHGDPFSPNSNLVTSLLRR